jgi:hypothetical protein
MDASKIKAIIVAVLASFVALYLGIAAATAQFETVAWVVGGCTLAGCLLLGRKIWLLIPFLGGLNFTLMIPGRPTTIQTAQLLVIGFCLLMFLSRKLKYRFRCTELEFWMLLLVLAVVQVYMRNPTGVGLFGGDTVGGRPYIIFAITAFAALILCGLQVEPKELRTAMKLNIAGGILNFLGGVFGWLFPRYGYWYGAIPYGRGDGFDNEAVDPERAGRITFLAFVPITLANWVSSHINPLKACFSLRWLPLVLLSLAFAAASGYRNVIGAVGLTYLVGLFYRGRLPSVLASLLIGVFALGALAVGNSLFPLPPNIQRSLSFLPGSWDDRYAMDAKASSEWRFEIWREVLLTDRWIDNKIFGDGLGFTSKELAMQQNLAEGKRATGIGISGLDMHRETILANGDYHSGPVSAVRTIGYVGLAIMALAQLRLLVHAHRQIQRARHTEWFAVTLFFAIPVVWTPVFFWLVFGGFGKDAPLILMQAAMLRMLQNNLPLPAYVPARLRHLPIALRNRLDAARQPAN